MPSEDIEDNSLINKRKRHGWGKMRRRRMRRRRRKRSHSGGSVNIFTTVYTTLILA
jgi:hypothetical protein